MRKTAKIGLLIILSMMFSLVMVACNPTFEGYEYKIVDDEVYITHYTDNSRVSDLTVPDTIEGLPVVKIDVFGLCDSVYLKTITFGKNIREIEDTALKNNAVLEKYIISEENNYFKAIDGVLFSKDGTELISFPIKQNIKIRNQLNDKGEIKKDTFGKILTEEYIEKYTVPNGVLSISPYAFYHQKYLDKLVISDSVKKIGESSFLGCSNLKDVKMPIDLEYLGKDSFAKNSKLKTITIHKNILEIADYAFYDCKELLIVKMDAASEASVKLGKSWYPTKLGNTLKELVITWNSPCTCNGQLLA